MSSCLVRGPGVVGSGWPVSGILFGPGSGSGKAYIWNNIVYDCAPNTSSDGIGTWSTSSHTVYVYNNTVQNAVIGYHRNNTEIYVAKNNIAQDCTTDGFTGTFDAASNYNNSDFASDAPGANSTTGEVTFLDEANDNFHLGAADAYALNAGTDLSADSNLAVTDDVDGQPRTGTFDIGADEVPTARPGASHQYPAVY